MIRCDSGSDAVVARCQCSFNERKQLMTYPSYNAPEAQAKPTASVKKGEPAKPAAPA
jgi:hypothetical protein